MDAVSIMVVGFVGMVCLLPLGLTLSHQVYKRIETQHQATWIDLGRSAFPWNLGAATLLRTRGWLKANHAGVGDARLDTLYRYWSRTNVAYYVFALIALAGILMRVFDLHR